MKKLILARYGGLSPKKQHHYVSNEKDMSFHTAPERKGIYAFLWPYIDLFLLSGTDKFIYSSEKRKREQLPYKYRKFTVEGDIWTHINIHPKYEYVVKERKGSWVRIDSEDFVKVFKKEYLKNIKEAKEWTGKKDKIKNPYLFITTDHLEIFIPAKTKIKGKK
jgi:hypothetical protein